MPGLCRIPWGGKDRKLRRVGWQCQPGSGKTFESSCGGFCWVSNGAMLWTPPCQMLCDCSEWLSRKAACAACNKTQVSMENNLSQRDKIRIAGHLVDSDLACQKGGFTKRRATVALQRQNLRKVSEFCKTRKHPKALEALCAGVMCRRACNSLTTNLLARTTWHECGNWTDMLLLYSLHD